jgi:sulfoxide reductase heme-binding subunit YedZ
MTYPWNDYSGRPSPLKLCVFVLLFLPWLWVALALSQGWLGARPLNEAILEIGQWTIRLVFLALAVTPLRQALHWQRLVLVRRMIGVAAFAYGLTHLGLYTVQQGFDLARVASEIALRIYLTIGFVALLGLAALAATSTDGMIRRLGARNWQRLHRLVYLIALLAVVHFWLQSKLEVWEPTVMAGLYVWLMGYRLLAARLAVRGRLPLVWVAALAPAAAVATALGEAVYFHFAYHVGVWRVIALNWSLLTGVRPAVVVFGIGAAVALAAGLRGRLASSARRRPRFA